MLALEIPRNEGQSLCGKGAELGDEVQVLEQGALVVTVELLQVGLFPSMLR